MDMAMMDGMAMGDMDMGDGAPTPYSLQRVYWAFVGAAIAASFLIRLIQLSSCRQRITSASRGHTNPAKPIGRITLAIATITAICREAWYCSFTIHLTKRRIQTPSLGSFLLACSYLVIVLILSFYRLEVFDRWEWEDLGYRTGYIATAQLPLVYMLSSKNNILGFFIGKGYERLNWIHRWTARVLFITATIHLIFWFKTWAQYDYILTKLQGDKITQRGFAAWIILLWIVLSSFRPFRSANYELFVVQHLITMAGFSAAIYLHLPNDMKYVFWIANAFPIFDRALRTCRLIWGNLRLQALSSRTALQPSRSRVSFGHQATFERLPGGVTRITINNPGIKWQPGQHVFFSCQGIVPLQSHPFTISSLPEDVKLVIIAKAHRGGTRKMHQRAQEELPLLASHNTPTYFTTFEGPYGSIRPLQQFDSLVLLAGSTGSTFTVPLLRSVLLSAIRCTRHIRFVWVVKSRQQTSWFSRELNRATDIAASLRAEGHEIELITSIYITCDDEMAGNVTEQGPQSDERAVTSVSLDEKSAVNTTTIPMEKINSISMEVGEERKRISGCRPDGTCCCTSVVKEGEPTITECHCNCGTSAQVEEKIDSRNNSTSTGDDSTGSESKMLSTTTDQPDPRIAVMSGRPHVRALIRKTLEQAGGESAVVVCGPAGLVADTRQAVVALSDERAVHKGTRAQGIYLHTESFSF